MKAKNAKVGTKVVVKEGVFSSFYEEGQVGVIEQIDSKGCVVVRFEHNNDYWLVQLQLDALKLLNKKEKRND